MSSLVGFDAGDVDVDVVRLVSGYIRENEATLRVPEDIISICVVFYFEPSDSFAVTAGSRHTIVGEDCTTAIKEGDGKGSIFLSSVVRSGVHRWRFRIGQHHPSNFSVCIGVWKDKHAVAIDQDMDRKVNLAYARLTKGDDGDGEHDAGSFAPAQQYSKRTASRRRTRCNAGDTADMVLDLNRLELSYSQNDIDYGVAFSVEKTAYRAGVFMYRNGDSIKLVSYT